MYLVSPSRILRCDEWTAQPRGLHFFSLYHILACACQHSQKAPWHQNVVNQESSISDSSCLMLYALIVTLQEHESYKDAHVKVSKRCRLRGKLFHKYQGYHTTHTQHSRWKDGHKKWVGFYRTENLSPLIFNEYPKCLILLKSKCKCKVSKKI